ncbi:DUF92 domain-containing protein [Bacillus sp. E(2018)]|uniref:DUF92 domain-containing protein n=1 Tax=Bacillus sp. E(2018) TaxID=2502239 RepID=UPI0010F5DA7E|nr:DUF92 domain-containing protein [Bacillus sp. E(2018)]
MIFILVGIAVLSVISALLRWLTIAGSITAFILGVIIYKGFGWQGFILLGLFFITSTLLTKWKKDKKQDQSTIHTEEKKGRTAGQVLANGGSALLAAIGELTLSDPAWLIVFAATFATATADTWASEIGVLSKRRPFHIKEWRNVEPGLSGAISSLGTVAAALGASLIGVSFYFLYDTSLTVLLCIAISGFLGNVADTLFGAWFEQKYVCSICKRETESSVHCGVKTVKVFGYAFFTNNLVNFSATFIGGLIAGGFYIWIVD